MGVVSPEFNHRILEVDRAVFSVRHENNPSGAHQALALAEDWFLENRGSHYESTEIMLAAMRIRREFGFPVDEAFWQTLAFIDHGAKIPAVYRKVARRALRAIMCSWATPSAQIATWIATADTEFTPAEIEAICSGAEQSRS